MACVATMAKHLAYGAFAEKAACEYLQKAGYRILATNFRYSRAEVDIIALKANLLVFAEVKARNSNKFGFPEEAVSARKQELLIAAATYYIEENNWQHDIRFDIISITGSGGRQQILHIEDAFH